MIFAVTPCVGVWIEIPLSCYFSRSRLVTPCVGVWIEIYVRVYNLVFCHVTPCVGVWIEIVNENIFYQVI